MSVHVKSAINPDTGSSTFNPARYKDEQRRQWNNVAAGWMKWWPLFEKGAQPLSERLVELAELRPGQQVLDVATGVGEPTVAALQRVGAGGHVTAIDQSDQMLLIAQNRIAENGLPQPELRQMDAEALDLPQSSFDAILSRFGLMFFPNLDETLARMRELLVPGGILATAVWDVPSKVPMLSLPMRIARQSLQLPPPPAGVPNPFNLADSAGLEQQLVRAGFENVRSERLTLTWDFASTDEFVQMTQDLAAPVTALLANHNPERQAEVWDAIAAAAQQYASTDGRIRVPSVAICVTGQRI